MGARSARSTPVERVVVRLAVALQAIGLHRIVYSRMARMVTGRMLRRGSAAPPVRTIASGLGRGLALRVAAATPHSYWMGTHEPHAQAVIAREVKPGMTVYDCGANIGYFAVI